MIRCLPLLGLAAQERARQAVAAVRIQQGAQQANRQPLPVVSSSHLVPQLVKLTLPQVPSSKPAVHLRVRRMKALLPPGLLAFLQLCLDSSLRGFSKAIAKLLTYPCAPVLVFICMYEKNANFPWNILIEIIQAAKAGLGVCWSWLRLISTVWAVVENYVSRFKICCKLDLTFSNY